MSISKRGSIHIQLKKPSGYADISLANIPVTLINQSIGCVYTTTTDTNGLALFELTAGICAISANQETTTGNRDYILSGSLSNIQFEANGEGRSVEIPLEVSERGRLLISEIYFSGCLWPDGKNVYNKDQYLTLVNNSDDLIFLDGLCIAQAGPRKRDKAFRMDAPYRYERNTFIHDVLGVSGNGNRISHSTGGATNDSD